MPAPATAASLLDLVARSGLLTADALDPYRQRVGTPRQLADALVKARLLTPYQSRLLLSGRHRGFFLTEKYKVLDLLGEGGMGRVFLCEHLILHKLQAVKVLTGADDIPGAVERFLREARALAALDHPNIARVYDVDRGPTGPFLVMEFVDGTNLHHLVAEHGPVDPARAAGFAQMAALGLHHAHQKGLVHRDIKPGNLIVDRRGVVKLLDLGLARFFDDRRNQGLTRRFDARNVLGTADFIAPEQALNSSSVDIRADIYSLGCSLYYLLTGRFPFPDGQPMEKLTWHQNRAFTPVQSVVSGVPDGLAGVLDRMVAKDPADRFQTPEAAAEALSDFATPPAPPAAEELPRHLAAQYQLGLCPPPSTLTLSASPTSPVQPSSRPADPEATDPHEPLPTPRTQPRLIAPTAPNTAPQPAPMYRLAPWAVAGLCGVLAVAAGLWAALAGRRPSAPPTPAAADAPLVVSGSTFVRPLVEHWAELYRKQTGKRIEYEPVGSPRGVSRMTEQVAHVGLTDVPLTAAQEKAAARVGGAVVQVPVALGAVAVAYTLPEAGPEPLKLSGPVLADLYRGRVHLWNDAAIQALNPGRNLPPVPVAAVKRADASGTSSLFTRFLATQVADWPPAATGSDPAWPVKLREGTGNDGLAAEVGRTPGGVGYVELALAVARRMPTAAVVNPGGAAVVPTADGVRKAADGVTLADLKQGLLNRPAAGAYPLVEATWAVAYTRPAGGRGPEIAAFLKWATTDGQAAAADLHYAPLPASLAGPVAEAVGAVQ